MISPSFAEFCDLAQQGNFVPVYQEWAADLDTPVSAWYRVCAGEPYSFLLESVEGGETIGRYSFLGCNPLWILASHGDETVQTFRDGHQERFGGDPFQVLGDRLQTYNPVTLAQLPPGLGGLFGFWGYELIQWIEPRVPIYPPTADDLPDGLWMQVDSLLVFDQVKRKIWAIAYADLQTKPELELAYQDACDRLQGLLSKLQTPLTPEQTLFPWTPPERTKTSTLTYHSNTTPEQFCQNVETAKEYIRAGDIFQVVLSQRLTTPYNAAPFSLYRSLRLINPSPYMAYFQFGDWQLIGSSPEVMVKADWVEDMDAEGQPRRERVATLRPIAGTRPRGKTVVEDRALGEELLADPKEVAEHVMLVDLGRNDVGRVCQAGTVQVDELMVIERYSHVMHIVSNVVGRLQPNQSAWELLKACFPAGTVSGAPKIRAMEIIHELEGCRRGPYSGAYGFYDFEGQLNTAITIRTMMVRLLPDGSQQVSVQAGAGIVADSVPEKEYQETLNKARGLLEAVRCLS